MFLSMQFFHKQLSNYKNTKIYKTEIKIEKRKENKLKPHTFAVIQKIQNICQANLLGNDESTPKGSASTFQSLKTKGYN